jgi:hypothetical protein
MLDLKIRSARRNSFGSLNDQEDCGSAIKRIVSMINSYFVSPRRSIVFVDASIHSFAVWVLLFILLRHD